MISNQTQRRGVERYVIDLDRCLGVDDDAMAFMLQSWVMATSRLEEWPGDQWYEDLQEFHPLSPEQYLKMLNRVMNSLDSNGLYTHIWTHPARLEEVVCVVRKGMAKLILHWI